MGHAPFQSGFKGWVEDEGRESEYGNWFLHVECIVKGGPAVAPSAPAWGFLEVNARLGGGGCSLFSRFYFVVFAHFVLVRFHYRLYILFVFISVNWLTSTAIFSCKYECLLQNASLHRILVSFFRFPLHFLEKCITASTKFHEI